MDQDNQKPCWLSDRDLAHRYGVSRITIWRWAKENPSFPKPKKIAPGTTRWANPEIQAYDQAVMQGAT